jgi:hypothetical protein
LERLWAREASTHRRARKPAMPASPLGGYGTGSVSPTNYADGKLWSVQLYAASGAGVSISSLSPVAGSILNFYTDANLLGYAGEFNSDGTAATVSTATTGGLSPTGQMVAPFSVPVGSPATLAIAAWYNGNGAYTNFNAALAAGVPVGLSTTGSENLGGDPDTIPDLPDGITSFSLASTLNVTDPPSISAQPTNLLILAGATAAFEVTATGPAPLSFQWSLNGANISGAGTSNYAMLSVRTNDAGNYSVLVNNDAGGAESSNAALAVVSSPTSQTAYAGSTATFTVSAIGPGTFYYQWQVNGSNLAGATSSTLVLEGISDTNAGTYSAVVSNSFGSVTTSAAILTVNDNPFFASSPQSQTVFIGGGATFTAAVYGAPPFVYQWYFNGSPLGSAGSGSNVAPLVLTDIGTNGTGEYWVEVVNGFSSQSSEHALLSVIVPPNLTLELSAGYPLLTLSGSPGSNFFVQYSTNLQGADWTQLLSLTNLPSSPFQFLDPAEAAQPDRFYRAVMH